MVIHDSRDPVFRFPGGSRPAGGEVALRLRVTGETPDSVLLRLWDGEERFVPMTPAPGDPALYEAAVTLPPTPCLLWYDFHIRAGGQFQWYGNAEDRMGGVGAPVWGQARSYQITVYDPAFRAPGWTKGAVWYQCMPDRFARGGEGMPPPLPSGRTYHESWDDAPDLDIDPASGDNRAGDFFGGTLQGIREKLPYLASLGVTALYLNPIFCANTNHRFDTVDWRAIDPALGTEADFRALCEGAAALGIRVVLDGVFSHSGSGHPFFIRAKDQPGSPYREWYRFGPWPEGYKSWWGFPTLPELNKDCPQVRAYFLTGEDAVVKRWPRLGAAGWRLDVADELPMDYLRLLRRHVKEAKPDALVLGEVWEDASNKMSYGQMRCYCLGDTLDGVMNYPLRQAAVDFLTGRMDAYAFKRRMDALYENYPPPFAAALLNVLGSHDRPRLVNVLAEADGESLPRQCRGGLKLTPAQRALGRARALLMLALVVAMPGMPCVYYGDEAGMEGAADPYNRGTFPWGREDAAFTRQWKDILSRKREVPALSDGGLAIEALSPDALAVVRRAEGAAALTLVNRGARPVTVSAHGRDVTLEARGHAFVVL